MFQMMFLQQADSSSVEGPMVGFQKWFRTHPLVAVPSSVDPWANSSLDSSSDSTYPCSSAMASFRAFVVEDTTLSGTDSDIPFAKTSLRK